MLNQNSRSKLSICIPTYKRNKTLIESIEAISRDQLSERIEICISDNDPNNNIENEINVKYQKLNLKYVKNSQNIGLDLNMVQSAKLSSSDYVYWLGDDDKITHETLPALFSIFESHNPDLVIIDPYSNDETEVITDINIAFKKLALSMPFGTTIIRNPFILDSYVKQFLNTEHVYSGVIWAFLFEKEKKGLPVKIVILRKKIVNIGTIEKTWMHIKDDIYFKKIPRWFNLIKKIGYDKKSVKEMKNKFNQVFEAEQFWFALKKENKLKINKIFNYIWYLNIHLINKYIKYSLKKWNVE